MNVFVLLPYHLDVEAWKARYAKGQAPDLTPYGYHHAEAMGCKITFSRATPRRSLVGVIDAALSRLLGFDLLHAWRNRTGLTGPQTDIIWTHTEREHLAVRALERLSLGLCKVKPMIAQSVWLMDAWKELPAALRCLYRYLLRRSEVLTFLSPLNCRFASELGLGGRHLMVPFGISLDSFPLTPPRERCQPGRKLRVLSLGNDKHRDWETLASALGDLEGVEVRIGSGKFPSALARGNFQVGTMTQTEIREAYNWADCVVLPLKDNMHASGVTVALEAVAEGVPLVVSRVGGLDAFFGDDTVHFVEGGAPASLRETVLALPGRDYRSMARTAQARLLDQDLTTEGYARRHVRLSKEMLTANDRRSS